MKGFYIHIAFAQENCYCTWAGTIVEIKKI